MKKILLIAMALVATIAAQAWTVKFTNPDNWAQPAVWCWDDNTNFTGGTWPGALMTKEGDVWVYTGTGNPGANAKIIFNNNNKGSQTANLDFVDGTTYDMKGPVGAKLNEYNVYFKDEAGWGDPIYAYTFGPEIFGGWPGKQLSKNADGLYVCTVEATSNPSMSGIIFSNGKEPGQGQLKTGDLTWETGKTYTNETAVTPGEDAIFLAGPFSGWSGNDEAYKFTKVSDTEYTFSMAKVAADFQFKVVINDGWLGNVSEALASGKAYDLYDTGTTNCTLTGGATDVKFSVDPVAKTLTVTYTPDGEVVVPPTPGDYTGWCLNVIGNDGNYADGVALSEDGTATVTNIELGTKTFEIKIWNGEDDLYYSNGSAVALDSWVVLSGSKGVQMTVEGATDGDTYDISWDQATTSVKVVKSVNTGVEEIESANAEAIYFNLQGVKVANPANGIYVKVVNGKAQKVVLN